MEYNTVLSGFALVAASLALILLKCPCKAIQAAVLAFNLLKLARGTILAVALRATKPAWEASGANPFARSTAALPRLIARTSGALLARNLACCILELTVWAVLTA